MQTLFSRISLPISLLLFAALGCQARGSQADAKSAATFRETTLELEVCEAKKNRTLELDADGDGRAEIIRVMKGNRELCRSVDLNFDGEPEKVSFFDEDGKLRRVQSDYDRVGGVDEVTLYQAGEIVQKLRVTKLDGKIDTWEFYRGGQHYLSERDRNGDGAIDQWWRQQGKGCAEVLSDDDLDGIPEESSRIEICPTPTEEGEQDTRVFTQGEERK